MSQQPAWLQGPPTGQGTKILCIVAIAASVLSTITERSLGIGASDQALTEMLYSTANSGGFSPIRSSCRVPLTSS